MTQVQGNDESTALAQYEEKYEEVILHCRLVVLVVLVVLVYLFGFVSVVLVMVLVRFVANYMLGGRFAEGLVICVVVGTQVDLLACDEKMVEELVDDLNSRLLQQELVALAWRVSFGVFQDSKDCDRHGGYPDGAGEEGELGDVGAPGTACAC